MNISLPIAFGTPLAALACDVGGGAFSLGASVNSDTLFVYQKKSDGSVANIIGFHWVSIGTA